MAVPYFKRIAAAFEEARNHGEAERFYVKAGAPLEAVEMHIKGGRWEAAHKVALGYLRPEEVQVRQGPPSHSQLSMFVFCLF